MLTMVVACSDDDTEGTESTTSAGGDASSTIGLTSEELDAWGDISIGLETTIPSEEQTTESKTESTDSKTETTESKTESTESKTESTESKTETTSSKTESTSSVDKDFGFGPYIPLD